MISKALIAIIFRKSAQLTDEKLNYVAEIETIKNQLSKLIPDKNVIKLAWNKLKPLTTVSGISSLFMQVAELVKNFYVLDFR